MNTPEVIQNLKWWGKPVSSGVSVKEIDLTVSEPYKFEKGSMIMVADAGTGESHYNRPIIINPKIAPIRWWHCWRWHLISERKKQVKECIDKFHDVYGKADKNVMKMIKTALGGAYSVRVYKTDHRESRTRVKTFYNFRADIIQTKPEFKHSCAFDCVYLGTVDAPRKYDLYFCDGKLPKILARWGNGEDEYLNKDVETINEYSPKNVMAIGLMIAREKRLIGYGK